MKREQKGSRAINSYRVLRKDDFRARCRSENIMASQASVRVQRDDSGERKRPIVEGEAQRDMTPIHVPDLH